MLLEFELELLSLLDELSLPEEEELSLLEDELSLPEDELLESLDLLLTEGDLSFLFLLDGAVPATEFNASSVNLGAAAASSSRGFLLLRKLFVIFP